MPFHHLAEMTYKQVERLAARSDLALLAVAPTEAHGPHLPLSVDQISGDELVTRAAARLADRGLEPLIAPAVRYCLADVANAFPGNVTIRFQTVADLVEDICVGLARWGFTRVMVVCGHGEPRNLEAIAQGLRAASQRTGLRGAVSDWLRTGMPKAAHLCREAHPEWDFHAGEWETAIVLLRRPELVDQAELARLEPNWEGEHLLARFAQGKDNWHDLGAPLAYFGDPRLATAETADRIYDLLAEGIVEEVLALEG